MPLTASVSDFNGGITGVNQIYPFDVWDGQAKTMVYVLGVGTGQPYWQPPYRMTPEWWSTLQNQTYSCLNSIIWLHNQENYGQFYGTQYKSKIAVVANMEPSIIKVFDGLSVEANKIPDFTYMICDSPFEQLTDIMDFEWRLVESIYYVNIKRNKKQPTQSGFSIKSLLTGDRMRSSAMKILFEFSVNNIPLNLKFLNINFELSKGHLNYQK